MPPSSRELTFTAIGLGIVLAVVMGAANVYLGLKAGMTVSASIPAAVVAMGILQGVLRRGSILESNLVQTGASAGESLAAGIIFTVPALVMTGVWSDFSYFQTSVIALAGGLLGILFMIPMRRVFVVDSPELPFPEGIACAEVLRAGSEHDDTSADRAKGGIRLIAQGLCVSALFKIALSFLGLFQGHLEVAARSFRRIFYFGCDASPALISVGLIVGLPIAVQIFAGGVIGWLLAVPLLSSPTHGGWAVDAAWDLWRSEVRYLGVGAMLVGGLASIWSVRRGLGSALEHLLRRPSERKNTADSLPSQRDLPGPAVIGLIVVCLFLIVGLYWSWLGGDVLTTVVSTVAMIVMSFFFTAVASYIVGLVGNSNSPVSGMTITALLGTALLMLVFGLSGQPAVAATLGVASVVCCAACTSGDICNDLKTGWLVGASPRNQQIMQVLGVTAACAVMAPTMKVLYEVGGGFGGKEFPAPQATLMASLARGVFSKSGSLPWDKVGWGMGIGVLLLVGDFLLKRRRMRLRFHVMPVAVGIYLPLMLTVPILLGGLIHELVRRRDRSKSGAAGNRMVLLASGMIAGEALMGVGLAVLAYFEVTQRAWGPMLFGDAGTKLATGGALAALVGWVILAALRKR